MAMALSLKSSVPVAVSLRIYEWNSVRSLLSCQPALLQKCCKLIRPEVRKIKYEVVSNLGVKHLWDDEIHYSHFKFDDMLDGACVEARAGDSCLINIATKVPAKGTVLAPKELTGKSFEAYMFVGVKGESGHMWMSTVRDFDGKKIAFRLMGFDALRFLSEHNKDWMVNYVALPMQRALKTAKEEGVEFVNPFSYVVHKGEIKLFVVGQ